jgi:hypothetical protein
VSILDRLARAANIRHLSDDAIAELWTQQLAGMDQISSENLDAVHLADCAQCRARFDDLSAWLTGLRDEANAEADDAFPPERLAIQQAQILRRLEALDRPARVIAFPRFAQPTVAVRRGPQRWVAAGLAAGVIVGLAAGQLLDVSRAIQRRQTQQPSAPTVARLSQGQGSVQPISASADDAFLYDVEAASTAPGVEALQALDALTPRVRDVDQAR